MPYLFDAVYLTTGETKALIVSSMDVKAKHLSLISTVPEIYRVVIIIDNCKKNIEVKMIILR